MMNFARAKIAKKFVKKKNGLKTLATDRSKQKVYLNRNFKYPNKPWHARKKYKGVSFHLGFFATKEQAEQAEREFDAETRMYKI